MSVPSFAPSSPSSMHSPVGLVASAVASGVATALVPPSRMSPGVRRSVHVGLGLAVGGATAWALARPDEAAGSEEPEKLPTAVRVGLSVALGSLVALTSAGGMAADAAVERALVRRGVRRPRLWIGLAAAALTAATSWAEARTDADGTPEETRLAPDSP